MLKEIFDCHKVPQSWQASLEEYLRDPSSVTHEVRWQMSALLSNNPQLFNDCIVAMTEEFQSAKKSQNAE